MKILTAEQQRAADRHTIEHEPISSIELMERAAKACVQRIMELVSPDKEIDMYCGMGNNGGDGLAIARLLLENNIRCRTFIVRFRPEFSPDAAENHRRLMQNYPATITEVNSRGDLQAPKDRERNVAVDALLGTGTSKAPEGLLADCITHINQSYSRVISIDLPSGLAPDSAQNGQKIVQSWLTLTFHAPKLAFLLPENAQYVQDFQVLDIGLLPEATENAGGNYYYITANDIRTFLRQREKFSHKGTYGHALLLAGGKGKVGAALMAAEACLRCGAGLLTLHSTAQTLQALAARLPEAMGSEDEHSDYITQIGHPERFEAVGFGPGTGTEDDTQLVLKKILQHGVLKLVIDADGLNILAENKTWLEFLPPDAVLTPHPKEFERLAGKQDDDMDRLKALKQFSARHNCIVVLKGAHTCVAMPDGNLFFNSTGNPGLAKGGTGDVLTGMVLGLMASGYNPPQAALTAVYLHGLAADSCASEMGMESILATDVIRAIPAAFRMLHKKSHPAGGFNK